jgi:hypothetical protein
MRNVRVQNRWQTTTIVPVQKKPKRRQRSSYAWTQTASQMVRNVEYSITLAVTSNAVGCIYRPYRDDFLPVYHHLMTSDANIDADDTLKSFLNVSPCASVRCYNII